MRARVYSLTSSRVSSLLERTCGVKMQGLVPTDPHNWPPWWRVWECSPTTSGTTRITRNFFSSSLEHKECEHLLSSTGERKGKPLPISHLLLPLKEACSGTFLYHCFSPCCVEELTHGLTHPCAEVEGGGGGVVSPTGRAAYLQHCVGS